jgi:hypothetical protein
MGRVVIVEAKRDVWAIENGGGNNPSQYWHRSLGPFLYLGNLGVIIKEVVPEKELITFLLFPFFQRSPFRCRR